MFAARVLNEACSKAKYRREDRSEDYKDKLEAAFRNRMKARYASGSELSFFPTEGQVNITPLGRWASCGSEGKQEVHNYLEREFRSEHRNIGRFLSNFFLLQDAPPGADALTAINMYFPQEELQALLGEYGDSAFSSSEESQAVEEFKSRIRVSG